MNIRSAIRKRISIRHYESRPVPEEILQTVVKSGENSLALDDCIRVRFHLIREGKLVAARMTYYWRTISFWLGATFHHRYV